MQSIANISNISIYIHFHATEKYTSRMVLREVFFSFLLTKVKTIYQITSTYMTNKLVTITQSCLGAYLYSAGTQHRNPLKLLLMTSMVICHQKGDMNTELKYTNKNHW